MVDLEARSTRILIIEDDEDDFVLASDYLNDIAFLNVELDHATNAKDGLAKLGSAHYDLCLVDYQLGATNGIEVLQNAKAMGVTAPIIMLTGQSDEILDQVALDFGAEDYLVKSELTPNRFARAIRYALARRDVEHERVERLKAEAENQSKSRFLAHLSHELRTPLTAILGYTELLMGGELGRQSFNELDVILRNGRHLLNLLNDVLDLSKIAAGKLELSPAWINVNSLVVDVFTLMQIPAVDKGLDLELHTDAPIPKLIYADPTRLRQVLINIVSNAIKFTDEGKVSITLRIDDDESKSVLHFDIADTGIGIPEEKMTAIFQPFTQVEDVLSKSMVGSGLGLAISSELAQRMGGQLKVTSVHGKGSCFTVSIDPGDLTNVSREHLTFQNSDQRNMPSWPSEKRGGRVLVVDDLRDIRVLIGHMVEQVGAECFYGKSGRDALTMVEKAAADEQQFDLILMDIHMPEMDGESAAILLRKEFPNLPIVALTAASMKGNNRKLIESGFNNVLSKPVDQQALIRVLETYLPESDCEAPNSLCLKHHNDSESITQGSDNKNPGNKKVFAVLVVEDDKDAANAVALLLRSFQIDAHVAHTTTHAMEKIINDGPWDHILLDLNLGDEDGLALAQTVREHGLDYPISILSGEQPDNKRLAGLDIAHVLTKPVQLDFLKKLFT